MHFNKIQILHGINILHKRNILDSKSGEMNICAYK